MWLCAAHQQKHQGYIAMWLCGAHQQKHQGYTYCNVVMRCTVMWGLSSAIIISLYSLSRKGDKSFSDSVLLPMCRVNKKRNPGTPHPLILQDCICQYTVAYTAWAQGCSSGELNSNNINNNSSRSSSSSSSNNNKKNSAIYSFRQNRKTHIGSECCLSADRFAPVS